MISARVKTEPWTTAAVQQSKKSDITHFIITNIHTNFYPCIITSGSFENKLVNKRQVKSTSGGYMISEIQNCDMSLKRMLFLLRCFYGNVK